MAALFGDVYVARLVDAQKIGDEVARLGLVERAPALKGMFIREAAGLAGDVPKLLRGEAL